VFANLVQLAGFGFADLAAWRFAGPNAGFLCIAATLFILGLALEGGEIDVAGAVGRGLEAVGRFLRRTQGA
jgi:hypothetical protein